MVKPVKMDLSDWNKWNQYYDDPNSELPFRLVLVQKHVAAAVEERGLRPISVVSICGGHGGELIGALEYHPRRSEITGRLVELDPDNASFARQWALQAAMTGVEVRNDDASLSDSYEGCYPAHIVILSGVFGHITKEDLKRTVSFLREICDTGSSVIWTSYEVLPERTEMIRGFFDENDFEETAFEVTPAGTFGVIVERYRGSPMPLERGKRIFTFGSSWKTGELKPSVNKAEAVQEDPA